MSDFKQTLETTKAEVHKALQKVADDHDETIETIVGEIVGSLWLGIQMRRAAKRGDIARTIMYSSTLIRHSIQFQLRRVRVAASKR